MLGIAFGLLCIMFAGMRIWGKKYKNTTIESSGKIGVIVMCSVLALFIIFVWFHIGDEG